MQWSVCDLNGDAVERYRYAHNLYLVSQWYIHDGYNNREYL